jgi:hypothetical protein
MARLRFSRDRTNTPDKLSGAFLPAPDEEFSAIIKVAEDGYVPEGVTSRARMGERIFTATLSAPDVERLQNDPRVVSIEPSRRLRSPDS